MEKKYSFPNFHWLFSCLLLFIFLPNNTKAQSLYEIGFTADKVKYKCFLVYFNEQDAYMRIGYNNTQKQYRVVNVKYTSITGEENGYHYFIMKGESPSFITQKTEGEEYNPDHLLWVWDKDKKSELPYITDDPDFKICWNLKNLQPMWAKENLSKNNKLEKPLQMSLSFSE
jgi:hypothetical protein